ncbi:MAG: hypothetical protein QOI10_1647 [Solirubrobacterales bacterium]|jgi:hypothetical protein|nr:hypothetical protein [Solirubrobacterales bacterium]
MRAAFFDRNRATGLAAVCATAAIAIAGCGGGSDSTTASTGASGATGASGTPLSQEEFVSQANAICADLNTQLEGLKPPTNDPASIADFASQGLAIIEPVFEQLQALTPPADLQSQFDDYVAAAQQSIDKEKELQAAAEAGDAGQVKSLVAYLNAHSNDPAARALGLDECAKDPQPQG